MNAVRLFFAVSLALFYPVTGLPSEPLSRPPSVSPALEGIYSNLQAIKRAQQQRPRPKTEVESDEEYQAHVVRSFKEDIDREVERRHRSNSTIIGSEWSLALDDVSFDWVDYKNVATNLRLSFNSEVGDIPFSLGGNEHDTYYGFAHVVTLIEENHPLEPYLRWTRPARAYGPVHIPLRLLGKKLQVDASLSPDQHSRSTGGPFGRVDFGSQAFPCDLDCANQLSQAESFIRIRLAGLPELSEREGRAWVTFRFEIIEVIVE